MRGWDWLWMTFWIGFWVVLIGVVVYAAVRLAQRPPRDIRRGKGTPSCTSTTTDVARRLEVAFGR